MPQIANDKPITTFPFNSMDHILSIIGNNFKFFTNSINILMMITVSPKTLRLINIIVKGIFLNNQFIHLKFMDFSSILYILDHTTSKITVKKLIAVADTQNRNPFG